MFLCVCSLLHTRMHTERVCARAQATGARARARRHTHTHTHTHTHKAYTYICFVYLFHSLSILFSLFLSSTRSRDSYIEA